MAKRLNQKWVDKIADNINNNYIIDEVCPSNLSAKWLISFLSKRNVLFKVYNLGAGVKRITTDIDVCPCCKRKL